MLLTQMTTQVQFNIDWIEVIGFMASVFVLISLGFSGKKFRILNSIGSIIWVTYGFLTRAWSVCFMNLCCFILNVVKIIKGSKEVEEKNEIHLNIHTPEEPTEEELEDFIDNIKE